MSLTMILLALATVSARFQANEGKSPPGSSAVGESTAESSRAAALAQVTVDRWRLRKLLTDQAALPAVNDWRAVAANQAWVDQAQALVVRLELHVLLEAKLREGALPYTDADRQHDFETHPERARYEQVKQSLALREVQRQGRGKVQPSPEKGDLATELAALEPEMRTRRTYRFAAVEDQTLHDAESELLSLLRDLKDPDWNIGALAAARRSLLRAQFVQEQFLAAHDAWATACTDIADPVRSPLYAGMMISPHPGLAPLGKDPQSGLFEFAHVLSGAIPVRGDHGALACDEETAIVFVLLPGGVCTLGALRPSEQRPLGTPNVDPQATAIEQPLNNVELSPFLLAKHEMNQGQWLRLFADEPSHYPPPLRYGDLVHTRAHPVENVSWLRCAREFPPVGLALPTEAQWEYAARAGTTTVFSSGDSRETLLGSANLADEAALRQGMDWGSNRDFPGFDDGYPLHGPVHAFRANPFGLIGMAGNVWEWCQDGFGSYFLPARAGDGLREVWNADRRCVRGGGYTLTSAAARSAARGEDPPTGHNSSIGVRPAAPLLGRGDGAEKH